MTALILNTDHSVVDTGALPCLDVVPWQARIRYGCTRKTLADFARFINAALPRQHGTLLIGSGDFHHLSLPLIDRVPIAQGLRVVVFDNHPDNMRFPFGVHCGSWVRAAAALPHVAHIHMVGMTSPDMCTANAWAHYLGPLRSGKLTYWSLGVATPWAKWLGVDHAFRNFDTIPHLLDALDSTLRARPSPTYLSLDKDVLRKEVVHTNWDQGRFDTADLVTGMSTMDGYVVGSDITGELSNYHYETWWKRALSRWDGQTAVHSPEALAQYQHTHARCNAVLLEGIERASA